MNRTRARLWSVVVLLYGAVAAFLIWLGLGVLAPMAHGQVPDASLRYQRAIITEAEVTFGLNAPVARIAAQLHQESAWREQVCSWAGACGLAQFMPATARWVAELDPALRPANPKDPRWAIQANVYYNHWLLVREQRWADDCDMWAGVLSGYNGGRGWLNRDRRMAAGAGARPDKWFCHVEHFSPRGPAAFEENRAYVRRILLDIEHRYAAAGWPGEPVCNRQ